MNAPETDSSGDTPDQGGDAAGAPAKEPRKVRLDELQEGLEDMETSKVHHLQVDLGFEFSA